MRNRDLFELYRVRFRSNLAEAKTVLVWAHRASDALAAAEAYAAAEIGNRFLNDVQGIDRLRMPDTDTEDFASVVWEGGAEPVWPE